jgi:hypothetical protein
VDTDPKAVRCAELLSRLEILDELIKEQAKRAEFVHEMGWDSTAFKKRSQLLWEARRNYVELLRHLLKDDRISDDHASVS